LIGEGVQEYQKSIIDLINQVFNEKDMTWKKNSIKEEDLVGDLQGLLLVASTIDLATSHCTNKLSKDTVDFFKGVKLSPIIV
jgi:hypothetical protein